MEWGMKQSCTDVCKLLIILTLSLITDGVISTSPPTLTGLPDSITLKESTVGSISIADKLFTLNATEPDGQTFTCTIDPGVTGFTLIDGGGGQFNLFLSSNPGFEYDTTPQYTLTLKCVDVDGNSSSGDLTIDILPNSPPTISGLPPSVTINDRETAAKKLCDVTVTDTEGDSYSCSLTKTPPSGPFNLQYTTAYSIWLDSSPSLDTTNSPYKVTVTCSDNFGQSSADLSIIVIKNSAPIIDDMPKSISVEEDDPGGRSIYTLTVTDSENDSFSCSQNVTPASSAFVMKINGSKFDVYLNSGHGLEYDTHSSYTILLSCTDGQAGTGTLTVTIIPNSPPSITSLDATVFVTAGEGEKKLHDLTVTDTESNSIVCTMGTTTPSGGPFQLRIESSAYKIYLITGSLTASSYSVPITCRDDYGSSTKTLTVTVNSNNPPVITGLPVTVTVSETETATKTLHTLAVTDAENDTITCSVTSSPSGPFSMTQNPSVPEYKVTLDANANTQLNAVTNSLHTVNITCTDSFGGSTSALLYVSVKVNNAPTIASLPDIVEVSENTKVETKLWDLTVTDTEGDNFICVMTVSPSSVDFDFRKDSTTKVYSAYLLANPSLSYATTPSYSLNFTCTDSPGGRAGQNSLTVKLVENRPPKFSNLPGSLSNVNAKTTSLNDVIFSTAATDDDGDTLFYSMTVSPSTTSFQMNTVTGQITAAQDLINELTSVFVVNITATDGKLSTTSTLGLTLTNVNTAPTITNLVLNGVTTIKKSESLRAGSALFTMNVDDPDAGQTQTITYTTVPTGQEGTFRLTGSAIALASGKTFDYETLTSYRLDISIADPYTTTAHYFLQIDILQVGEPCVFDKDPYQIYADEAVKGGGNIDNSFALSDPDSPDTHTYTLITTTYSKLFDINPNTGIITYAIDYDVDQGANPSNLTLNVKCTDSFGETGTATISLYIQDVNDNPPDFNAGGYVLTYNQYTDPGDLIGQVTATDRDSGNNAEIEYTATSSTGGAYFTYAKNGNVYLAKSHSFEYGTTHRFTLVAVDKGSPQLTGTTYVDLIYQESVTTTTTTTVATTVSGGFWDDAANIALVAALVASALMAIGLLLFFLLRKKSFNMKRLSCKNLCKCKQLKRTEKPPKRVVVTPKNPKGEAFKLWDDNDLNVQREPFKTQRVETSVPQTMVME